MLLAEEASARVTARQRFYTIFANHVLALLAKANVRKCSCLFVLFVLVGQDVATETTLLRVNMAVVFVAVFASVVWLGATAMAKIVFAIRATDAIPAHVDGGGR